MVILARLRCLVEQFPCRACLQVSLVVSIIAFEILRAVYGAGYNPMRIKCTCRPCKQETDTLNTVAWVGGGILLLPDFLDSSITVAVIDANLSVSYPAPIRRLASKC